MSRDSVAWVTSNPSALRSSRSCSWLATLRVRTIFRMAAWRWVFMGVNLAVHHPAGDDGEQGPGRRGGAEGREGGGRKHGEVGRFADLERADLAVEAERPRAVEGEPAQRCLAREARGRRLRPEVGVAHPCLWARLERGQCATAAPASRRTAISAASTCTQWMQRQPPCPRTPRRRRYSTGEHPWARTAMPRSRRASANGPAPLRTSAVSSGDSARCTASGSPAARARSAAARYNGALTV